MELHLTLSLQSFLKRYNIRLKYIPYPCGTVFYNPPSGVFSTRDTYSQKYIPYPCGTVFSIPQLSFQILTHTVNWNTFHTPVELYSTLSQQSFLQDIMTAWNTLHIPVDLYFTLSPVDFSIRDNFSLKYIPYPCETVFWLSPAEFFNKR